MTTNQRISDQEVKDREIASYMLKRLIKPGNVITKIQNLPVNFPIDLYLEVQSADGITQQVFVEVKTRNKDAYHLKTYPWAELKISKFNDMAAIVKQYPGARLMYAVILNNKDFYLYDLNLLDWTKVTSDMMRMKKTEYDPNSEYEIAPVYQFRWELGICKNIEEARKEEQEYRTLPLF